jgi:hypothetical protein
MHLHLFWILVLRLTGSIILSLLTGSVNVEYDSYFTKVRDKLPEVYGKYVQKYAGVWQQQPPPAPIATKKREAWKNN